MAKENSLSDGIMSNISASLAEQLAQAQLRRLLKEEREEAEKAEQLANSRKAGIESMMKEREHDEAVRRACNHKKPFGESNLAGQRLHSATYLYVCQMCGKEWRNNEVPLDLRIDVARVGGPSY